MSKLIKLCLCALIGGLPACAVYRTIVLPTPKPNDIIPTTQTSQEPIFTLSPQSLVSTTAPVIDEPGIQSTIAITQPPVSATLIPPSDLQVITLENAGSLRQLFEIRFNPWSLVLSMAWSPDGEHLAVAAGNAIFLYETERWQQLWSFEIGALTQSLAFSPDGAWLAAGSRDGFVRIWPVASIAAFNGSSPSLAVQAHHKGVNSVAFNPVSNQVGDILASGGNDAIARFWSLSNGDELGYMIGGTFAVPSIAFYPDGSQLAVTNGDRIRLREVGSERILGTFASDEPLYSLAFSPDGSLMAAGGSDNLIRLWKPEQAFRTGQAEYAEPIILSGHTGQVGTYRSLIWQVLFSPSGQVLASAGGDGSVRLWDIQKGDELNSLIAHPGGAACLAFRPDSTALATGGLDNVVRIWGVSP